MKAHKRTTGFTLIELLVVISVIALLMGILLTTLSRVRKQARATVCLANVNQWGIIFNMYRSNHEGKLLGTYDPWWHVTRSYYDGNDLLLCPEATRPGSSWVSSTAFEAWRWDVWLETNEPTPRWMGTNKLTSTYGSYGTNYWTQGRESYYFESGHVSEFSYSSHQRAFFAKFWSLRTLRGLSSIPMLFDCAASGASPDDIDSPPQFDGEFTKRSFFSGGWGYTTPSMRHICANRHKGKIGMTFMDGSSRRVGMKELWTFKWHAKYNTENTWTLAGGVQPEDWPEWMRGFRDY